MIKEIIAEYHELLAAGDAGAEWEQLQAGMERSSLRFRERYVCNVLRPLLLSRAHYEEVMRASTDFFGAIRTLYGWLLEDEGLRARLGLLEVEEAAIRIEPGFPSPDGIGRLDGFLDASGRLRFVEYNADSPGGMAFGHVLAQLFLALPTMQRIAAHYRVTVVPILDDVLSVLLAHYRTWQSANERPTIGIVDWEGLGTAPEFVLCQDHFERAGYPSVITHPGALRVRGGRLWDEKSGQRIDIVYKRVLVGELLERLGLENVLTEAMRQHAACVVNSYRAQMLFKKSLFALLSEMADEAPFPPEQRRAIREHLPWTRIVREGSTEYQGRRVDLLEHVLRERENLALKPNSEYGGTGVVLGWESTDEAWQRALVQAQQSEQPYIVQERIHVSTQPFPLLREGELCFEPRIMDLDPYVYAPGTVRGAGGRLGASGLLNVTAGGGSAVPLVLVS
ncbi:MAG: circularly permuted type 2 ATP-grasp protein [Ardenticatenaceae bacterium]